MKRERQDKRRQKRLGATLPVRLGKTAGVTRDVSASGVFFETDVAYHRGSKIHFEINLETPWGKAVCDCDGKIVRVERHDGSVGIAVQFAGAKARASISARAAAKKRARPVKARRRKR
jgi:hypothetical protein